LAGGEDVVPERFGMGGGEVELKAIFAGIAGTGNRGVDAADLTVGKVVGTKAIERNGRKRLKECRGPRSLQGEQTGVVADVADLRVEMILRLNPFEVFLNIRGVDDEHEAFAGVAVHEKIVDRCSFAGRQDGILGLAVGEPCGIVGGDVLDEIEGLRAGDFELSHVTDIEESGGGADGGVFFRDAGVFDGHCPAAEGDQLCSQFLMNREQSRPLVRHGYYCTAIVKTILPAEASGQARNFLDS
jgi:hypothetical protein